MSPETQTIIALSMVGLALFALIFGRRLRRRRPGCGGDCGCPAKKPRP